MTLNFLRIQNPMRPTRPQRPWFLPCGQTVSEESKSLLLLGEAGSGKTQAVDWCLQKLKEENWAQWTQWTRWTLRVFLRLILEMGTWHNMATWPWNIGWNDDLEDGGKFYTINKWGFNGILGYFYAMLKGGRWFNPPTTFLRQSMPGMLYLHSWGQTNDMHDSCQPLVDEWELIAPSMSSWTAVMVQVRKSGQHSTHGLHNF